MRIFVYGSLRHKQGNSHWMTNAQLLGDFSIDNYPDAVRECMDVRLSTTRRWIKAN